MHSTRRAYMDIPASALADIGPLLDAGLEVISSAASDRLGVVKLLIAGDALPEACEIDPGACVAHIQTVTVILTRDTYGRQSITRVTNITLAPSA